MIRAPCPVVTVAKRRILKRILKPGDNCDRESQPETIYNLYTSLLKIGSPKNREFWEILPFSKTCNFLKIGNF